MRYPLLAVVLLTTSCSDGPGTFDLDNQFPAGNGEAVRLTYNVNDDRTPAWAVDADSVYFSAESYLPFVPSSGLLLAAPREGGVVNPIFPQGVLAQPAYVAPAVSHDGDEIAFFEVTRQWRYMCAVVRDPVFPEGKPDTTAMLPLLQQAVLRVRPLDHLGGDAATLTVDFGGRHLDTTRQPFGLPGVTVIEGALFQRQYGFDRSPVFRASWAPDGQRLVFSNGKQLFIWTKGGGALVPIPNTDDAVWPAWSPDGEWIAFSRLTYGRAEHYTFHCQDMHGRVTDVYDVTIYNDPLGQPALPQLHVIRANGGELRSLGAGEAPAWVPGSGQLVFSRSGNLWRSSLDGTSQVMIPHTAGGREPAVSSDGKWVAFTKNNAGSNKRDVWVAPL